MIQKFFISVFLLCAIPTISQGVKANKKSFNPIAKIVHDPGLCGIFHTWGFIGDSLCSGEHECKKADGKTGYIDLYDYSWGQRICAYTGTKGDNYSQGGETAHGWIDHFWNNPKNRNNNIDAKADPKKAYIMALGVNDFHHSDKYPLGSESDINTDDFSKNADTFYGNYAGIIQRVRSIAPKCKIFVVTMPLGNGNNSVRIDYNKAIRHMAATFPSVYVIDLEKYSPDYRKESDFHKKYYLSGHLNAMGYEFTAWMFINYINWIIENNWKDFEQTAFINTPYSF